MDFLQVPATRKRGIHASLRKGGADDVRELISPSMGFRAMGRYLLLKMVRQTQDPHNVALAAAIGMWVNFLPLPGLGGLSAAGLALLFRVSVPVAVIAQLPSNPLTFPLLWWVSYLVGSLVVPLPDGAIPFSMLMDNFTWAFLMSNFWELVQGVMITMTVGGQILGIITGFITYRVMYSQVKIFWAKRRARAAAVQAGIKA